MSGDRMGPERQALPTGTLRTMELVCALIGVTAPRLVGRHPTLFLPGFGLRCANLLQPHLRVLIGRLLLPRRGPPP